MILIHSNNIAETAWADGEKAALDLTHGAVVGELIASRELVDTNELDVEDVTVIGHHNGEPVATRGPFTEGTEWIGGYYIVDVVDRERAVEIAGRFTENRYSPIEIRRVVHTPPTS
ncbi:MULTISPECIES: YciI family protein [Cryobacterium]|nr:MULTISPECIES: YciI family protein [Cryobacterium]